MARPAKEGLEYFPLDTDIDQDEKVIVVVAKHGMRGFGVIIRLMMEIYKNGYFYPWTEREQYVFAMKIKEEVPFVSEVVNDCLKWGFFHEGMFKQYSILTSKGFQSRYLLAVSRRKGVEIQKEYSLINVSNKSKNADNNSSSNGVVENNQNSEIQQKKLKEKKSNNPRQAKQYDEDNTYYKMAKYFFDLVTKVANEAGIAHLLKKSNLQTWADEMRKLVEIDGINKQQAKDVMDWVVQDDFWKVNILSAKKLRDKFPELAIKMNAAKMKKSNIPVMQQIKDSRDKEIEFQKWLEKGGDPDEFRWD